jgi:hypothetical protein
VARLLVRHDQAAIKDEIELVLGDGYEREGVNRLVEVREQAPGEGQGLVFETSGHAVVNDEVHAGLGLGVGFGLGLNRDCNLAVGNLNGIRHHLDSRIEHGLAGANVVLP